MKPVLLAVAAATMSCASVPAPVDPVLELERQSGGTLAYVLLDPDGAIVAAYRAHEPFAFCSSFKVALAGVAFQQAAVGAIDLDAPVALSRDVFPGYQPVMQAKWERGDRTTTLREAIDATILTSDNMAANLLIDAVGGPQAVTARWREWGTTNMRLDRRETALNENARGDLRDTASPFELADTMRQLIGGNLLASDDRDQLARLTHKSTTGLDRVRAGLREGRSAGDKTGTCRPDGHPDQQVNDVGWVKDGQGRKYWFAVMLARPTVDTTAAKAIHAEFGRLMAGLVD